MLPQMVVLVVVVVTMVMTKNSGGDGEEEDVGDVDVAVVDEDKGREDAGYYRLSGIRLRAPVLGQAGKDASPDTVSASAGIWAFPASGTVERKHVLFRPPMLHRFVTAAQTD